MTPALLVRQRGPPPVISLTLVPLRLQVCQFVLSVNGLNVLNLDYRTVSHLILTGPRTVVMEVMEETEE